jgi:colanic acid biosynthesis glycosyl transferase WcaI
MRLLLINQFFGPDTAPTGRFLMDLARAVEGESIQVTAICCASDYGASGHAGPDVATGASVRILRPSSIRFSRDTVRRVSSYGSFLAGAIGAGFRVGRPDTVVTLTTPPLTSVFGRILKLARGCRHFIWEMDVYPDIAVDLGALKPRSLLTCLIGALADWSRRNADGIIVLGEEMKARLIARDIPEHKIHVAENWADGAEIAPLPFPEGPLVVHYSGNFGMAHEFDTISAAIKLYANDPRFQFVFAGDGIRRRQMENFCLVHGIGNVLFHPYSSRAKLGASLAEGHLGLVTQLPPTCGSIVPSKTYGIMAAGRPILYIGPRVATPARMIERFECGWQVNPGDTGTLIGLLEKLCCQRQLISEAGGRGRQAFEQHYDRPLGVARIVKILGLIPEPRKLLRSECGADGPSPRARRRGPARSQALI